MSKQQDILREFIVSLLPSTEMRLQDIVQDFRFQEFPKHHLLLREGLTSSFTYFLESGFVRSFVLDEGGQEVTTNLFSAPCFVNDFLSFFKQEPTQEQFETLTPCRVWALSYQDMQRQFHTIPEFREFGRMLLVTNYSQLHERMLGMIRDTAETRYRQLLDEHHDLFQHVPLKIIASYLGITDSSLSRIRKEVANK